MTTPTFKELLAIVADGSELDVEQSRTAFEIMMSGEATPSQLGGFLMALRVRGPSVEEITGAAMTMRAKALTITAPDGAIDTCGTGGDGAGTLNISSAAAFVVAACGVPVAKHGNRAMSSKSGAADVLAALGVNVEAEADVVQRCLDEAGICFLMAPRHHGAMRHVGPTRVELGTRTIFNLLGPLSNPAGVKRQLIGVFERQWIEPLAEVLGELGSEKVWVVHGSDGLDELTTTGPSFVAELDQGKVRTFEITPGDAGIEAATAADLKGGTAAENAEALTAVLAGAPGPYRDIVLLNAAAALLVTDKADDLAGGMAMARDAVDSGGAAAKLARLTELSHG